MILDNFVFKINFVPLLKLLNYKYRSKFFEKILDIKNILTIKNKKQHDK